MSPDLLVFDIWIYDGSGNLFEGAYGVHMRDVSAGRMKPPQWIIQHGEQDPRERLKKHCRAFSLIELKTLLPFAEKTLSEHEQKRYRKMGEKRAELSPCGCLQTSFKNPQRERQAYHGSRNHDRVLRSDAPLLPPHRRRIPGILFGIS
jgi:hypothetical protein